MSLTADHIRKALAALADVPAMADAHNAKSDWQGLDYVPAGTLAMRRIDEALANLTRAREFLVADRRIDEDERFERIDAMLAAAPVLPLQAEVAEAALTPDAPELPAERPFVGEFTDEQCIWLNERCGNEAKYADSGLCQGHDLEAKFEAKGYRAKVAARADDDLLRESLGSAYVNVPDPAAFMAELRERETAELNGTDVPFGERVEVKVVGHLPGHVEVETDPDRHGPTAKVSHTGCPDWLQAVPVGTRVFVHVLWEEDWEGDAHPVFMDWEQPTPELDAHVAEIFGENHQVKPAEPIRFEPATAAGILGAIAENEAARDRVRGIQVRDDLQELGEPSIKTDAYIKTLDDYSLTVHFNQAGHIRSFLVTGNGEVMYDYSVGAWSWWR